MLPTARWGRSPARGQIEESFRSKEARRMADPYRVRPKRLSVEERTATPDAFRDLLLSIARSCASPSPQRRTGGREGT